MKKLLVLFILFFCFFSLGIFPQEKEIREDMVVINVEVPVRVMHKGKPVDNLKKSDFRLFENGVEQVINGFYQVRKKIKKQQFGLSSERVEEYEPRYFVLVFRLYKKTNSVDKAVKYLFNNILIKSDKLLLFINDKTLYFDNILDKSEIIRVIDKDIRSESLAAKQRFEKAFQKVNQDLKNAWFQSSLDGGGSFDGSARMNALEAKRFLENYEYILKEYRKKYLTPSIDVYYNFANHLEKIDIEKWVITFYQFEKFPTFKLSGRLRSQLGDRLNYIDRKIKMVNDFPSEEISKLFYKVNTTFHSLFFTTYENTNSRDLALTTISTDLENSFREITKITGGDLIVSNKLELSLEKIVEKEDVYYMLTYSPPVPGRSGKVSVQLENKKYDVHFDNNIRADYISRYLKNQELKLSAIKIKNCSFINKKLLITLEDIMMRKIKGKKRGRVKIHLLIKDKNGEKIFDQIKTIETSRSAIDFIIGLNWMEKGEFNLIIDVTDLLTGKSVFYYKVIRLRGDGA